MKSGLIRKIILIGCILGAMPLSAIFPEIPVSQRSLAIYEKYSPLLSNQLLEKGLRFGAPIFIRIFKKTSELELWVKKQEVFSLFKVYQICHYSGSLGPKTRFGDLQSPEGFYFVTESRMNPWSQYHLSFNLGYPNQYDRSYGRTGSALMVHGNCVSIGCYAMTDSGINEIYVLAWEALKKGQPFFRVHIFPFRLTKNNLAIHKNNVWYSFWKNLKTGYDYFEIRKTPPNVLVRNKLYFFE